MLLNYQKQVSVHMTSNYIVETYDYLGS